MDVICVNRYYGWYIDMGYLQAVSTSWIFEMKNWKKTFNKAIIVTEYGADSIPGMNQVCPHSFYKTLTFSLVINCVGEGPVNPFVHIM